MKKRILSLLLVSSLIFSYVPVESVFAAENVYENDGLDERIDEAQESSKTAEDEINQQENQNAEGDSKQEENEQKESDGKENIQKDMTKDIKNETQDLQKQENGDNSSEADPIEVEEPEEVPEQKTAVSVLASAEDYGDLSEYDVYLANELINFGRYDFMTQEYQSACEIYVRSGQENGLSSKIAAWRALTFDGASEVGYAQAEVGYYEAILFDLVYDEEGGGVENAIYDNIMDASEAVKASNWKKICEGGEQALMNMPVSEDNLEAVYSVVQKCDSLQGILDKIGNVTDILGYVDSGKDFLDKLSELSVLVSVSDETKEIITDLAESYNKVDAMNAALDEYALLFTDLMNEATILSYLAGRTTLEELSKEWAGGLWKSVIAKMNSAGLAVEVGQTVGKMASNFLVSTDGIIETFYSMEAMTKFTELLTSQVRTYGERFKSNPSVENAKKFNAAFQLLYKAHVINLDYAEDFLNQVKTEGFINWLFQGTKDENYQDNLRSISNMKADFSTYIDTKKAIALSLYQEQYPSNIDTGLKDVEVEIPVSDEQLVVIESEIQSVSEQISDITFSEDKTFNADVVHYGNITLKNGTMDLNGYNMTVYGDLYIQGGLLRLSGGHLTVNGNVHHSGGMLYLSGGTFETNENYWLGSENADGTINTSSGEIKMDDESDLLKVAGDFYMYSYYGSDIEWIAGTTEIGGNLYKYHSSDSTGISGNHKIVFTGEKDLIISSNGDRQLNLANVEILNATGRKVTLEGDIGISGSLVCDSEELTISAQNAVLSGKGFSNLNLIVDSDLTYDSGTWSLNGKSLHIKGDMYQNGGTFNVEKGNMKIEGSVYQQNGMLNLSGGTAEIGESYYLGREKTDGTIEGSNGEIRMTDEADVLKVMEDLYIYNYRGDHIEWTEGRTEIGGNLYKYLYNDYNTGISGNHKIVFNGEKDLIISSKGERQLDLANVEILNAAGRKVTLEGDIGISGSLVCDSEELTISAQNAVLSGKGFSNLNLIVDSDLTYDSGTWSLNGKSLHIKGDMYQNGGTFNVEKGNMRIDGSTYHQSGMLNLSGGTAEIGESYYLGREKTDGTIEGSNGEIRMTDEADVLKVMEDLYIYNYRGDHIEWTEGRTVIGGNLYKYLYNDYNTGISGNHKIVFNGEKDLIISSKGERQLDLANVEILNAAGRKVTLEGDIGISGSLVCDSEELTISAQNAVLSGKGFSNLNLIVDSDLTYDSGTWSLNGKSLHIKGDMYQNGGTFNVEKGNMKIEGSVYQQNGMLNLSGGTAEIGESYYLGREKTDGTIEGSNGEIRMTDEADVLKVMEDLYIYNYRGDHIEWTEGRTEIGGNLYKYLYNDYNTGISGNHKIVFNGEKDLIISSKGERQLDLANVEILNAAGRKVTLEGDIGISGSLVCDSEELTISAQNAVLSGKGFSNLNLIVDSDLTYDSGTWSLNGKSLHIKGDMYQNGGTFNVEKGNMKIEGSVYQQNGMLNLSGGTAEIGESYYLGREKTDGTIEGSNGEIRMTDEADILKIMEDLYIYNYRGDHIEWTEGRTEIGGNLYKYLYNDYNTGISGNHKIVFNGEKDLIISSKGERQLDLANVEILNAAARKVTLEGDIGISGSLISDREEMTISAQDAVLSGDGFSNLNLIVDGDLTYDGGTWLLNGKSLQVNGDIYQKGGILNLGKGSLTVSGSYYHQSGTLNPSGGSVDIGENYYNAVPAIDSSSGDPVYNTSSGLLYMNNASSFMNVAENFVMASSQSHSDKLTAGTIAIQGDFTQISGNAYNFACKENMKVILNGNKVQNVSFASTNSKFNILQLTKDKDTGYVFSPDSCWNELEEVGDEFAILVQPEDCAAVEGGQAVFTVKASGDELSYQWQYCEPEGDEWKDVELVESMSDTLTIPVTEDIDGRKYRCIVKNGEDESLTTEEAVLNVKYELTILQQPESFIGKAGDTAIFSVMAAGYQVSYQWQYQNPESEEWRNSSMAGSSSSTLVVSVNSLRNGQKYRCVLTDGDGKMLVTDTVSLRIKVENPFTDVSQGQYYYDSVLWAYENGIASGLSEDEFAPDEQCTRAQVVIFLWRAKGQPKSSIQELPFEDVEKGSYYYEAVAWAYENNIVNGVDSTHFGPDDSVSRGQFVTFLYRTEGQPGFTSENPFSDVAQWAYYYDPVLWAYEKGIASGLSEDTFGPDEFCTRGQVVTFLYRAYN